MARLQLYALIAGGFILGLLGIYSAGIMRGQDKVKRKLDEDRLKNMKIQKDVEDEIEGLHDDYFVDRARNWVRKDKHE
tara:strand:- start:1747 stop:1980 length:234 start_codon:yes stop_codon:yes gene_type:complete